MYVPITGERVRGRPALINDRKTCVRQSLASYARRLLDSSTQQDIHIHVHARILYLALKACASPIYSGVQPPREKDACTCPLLLAEDTSLCDISK